LKSVEKNPGPPAIFIIMASDLPHSGTPDIGVRWK
jgi:hypothetical protein